MANHRRIERASETEHRTLHNLHYRIWFYAILMGSATFLMAAPLTAYEPISEAPTQADSAAKAGGSLGLDAPGEAIGARQRRGRGRRGRSRRGRSRQRRSRRSTASPTVTVPLDIGIGPAASFFTGPIQDDQLPHYAIRLSIAAIIDAQTLRENQHRIPRQYRNRLRGMREVRYSPLFFIPSVLHISPKIQDTGLYGLTFRPLGIGTALLSNPVRFSVDAGLLLTYLFIHSDTLPSPTHFLRPGLEVVADLEIPLAKSFLISLGWSSSLYPPQPVGSAPWEFSPFDASIWHIGQAYLKFHFRVPYTTQL